MYLVDVDDKVDSTALCTLIKLSFLAGSGWEEGALTQSLQPSQLNAFFLLGFGEDRSSLPMVVFVGWQLQDCRIEDRCRTDEVLARGKL